MGSPHHRRHRIDHHHDLRWLSIQHRAADHLHRESCWRCHHPHRYRPGVLPHNTEMPATRHGVVGDRPHQSVARTPRPAKCRPNGRLPGLGRRTSRTEICHSTIGDRHGSTPLRYPRIRGQGAGDATKLRGSAPPPLTYPLCNGYGKQSPPWPRTFLSPTSALSPSAAEAPNPPPPPAFGQLPGGNSPRG